MVEVVDSLLSFFLGIYDDSLALNVLFLAIILVVVSLFIWKFYKSVSKKNLIELNLSKYNRSNHPIFSKFLALILYLLEYIIIMPLLIILWFTALFLALLIIAKRPTGETMLIAAALIGSIRILSYFKRGISQELAKLLPLVALSIYLLTPGDINLNLAWAKILEIPLYVNNLVLFIVIIFAVEIVMRVFYAMFEFWASEGGEEEAIEEITRRRKLEE